MRDFLNQHFVHFVLFVLDCSFSYLHRYYDVYYNFYCEKFELNEKKGEIENEESVC